MLHTAGSLDHLPRRGEEKRPCTYRVLVCIRLDLRPRVSITKRCRDFTARADFQPRLTRLLEQESQKIPVRVRTRSVKHFACRVVESRCFEVV